MSFSLNPIVRTVSNMIIRYGGVCTLVVTRPGDYDYDTSSCPVVTTNYPVKMISFDYNQRMSGVGVEDSSLIRNGDKQLFMMLSPGQPVPSPGNDSIIFKGIKHNVITVKDINPSGLKSYVLEVYCRE